MTEYQKAHKDDLILLCASMVIEYRLTVREVAEKVGIGKTTVHRWLTEDLKDLDSNMYERCMMRLKKL